MRRPGPLGAKRGPLATGARGHYGGGRMMTSPFRPPRWLKSPHLQTIGAAVPLWAPPRSHAVQEEEDLRIPLGESDGFLHARAWWSAPGAPAVIILHGIAGSKESHCVM